MEPQRKKVIVRKKIEDLKEMIESFIEEEEKGSPRLAGFSSMLETVDEILEEEDLEERLAESGD